MLSITEIVIFEVAVGRLKKENALIKNCFYEVCLKSNETVCTARVMFTLGIDVTMEINALRCRSISREYRVSFRC